MTHCNRELHDLSVCLTKNSRAFPSSSRRLSIGTMGAWEILDQGYHVLIWGGRGSSVPARGAKSFILLFSCSASLSARATKNFNADSDHHHNRHTFRPNPESSLSLGCLVIGILAEVCHDPPPPPQPHDMRDPLTSCRGWDSPAFSPVSRSLTPSRYRTGTARGSAHSLTVVRARLSLLPNSPAGVAAVWGE
jgi:hypothetical protein